jgi:hypothetical protein
MLHSFFRKILSRGGVVISFGISFCLVLFGFIWAYVSLSRLTTPIILHFSNATGIDRIGTMKDIVAMGAFGLLVVAINALFSISLEARDAFWARIVAVATLFMSVLLFILFSVIISVN